MNTTEGWKLVPVEPPMGMRAAGAIALHKASAQDLEATDWEMGEAYKAMLAAAPTPPEQPAAQPEQPEPGGLTDERIERAVIAALSAAGRHAAWDALTYCSGPYEVTKLRAFMFPVARAIEREVLSTTRKRSPAEVARIMEAVDEYADASYVEWRNGVESRAEIATRAEVERLLRGEA